MKRGLSLIELLIAVFIVMLAMGALARAFTAGLIFEAKSGITREAFHARTFFEDKMSSLISGASLQGGTSYFVSPIPVSIALSLTDKDSSSLVFTTWSSALSLNPTDQDFEALNSRYGPVGGAMEIAFSTTPVGDARQKQGLFLREQRPPDGDLTQGGEETLLGEQVSSIRFEFYDGAEWQTTWDSRNGNKGQLPSLVRVTYLLKSDDVVRSFLVRVLAGGKQ